ncbi:MAG TPA: molybdate ABC transporter substrate-binding protein [Methylovirgula sp.]|nr:molybdate ABC transporter substrate-binding protein [Methylovirgula sp.]
MNLFIKWFVASGLLLLAATAPAAAQSASKLVVFAAASMQTALDAITPIFVQQKTTAAAVSYGSSAILAKQIEQGAPADVFISADVKWMDYLEAKKLLAPGTRRNLLGNNLVLVAPKDQDVYLKIKPGFDLAGAAGDGKIAVCTVESCPAGIYAKEAFQKLGIWQKVEPKLAQAGNVRDALALVARGEARFGIVYATDAKAEPRVKVVDTFPADSHSPIIYPVAVVASSKNPDAAVYAAFLTSQAAVKILTAQGFTILSNAVTR